MEIIDNIEKLSINNNDNNKNNNKNNNDKNNNKNNYISNTKFIIVFNIEIKIILDKYEKCLVSKINDIKLENNKEGNKKKLDKTKKGKIYKYKIKHNCDKFLIKIDYNEKEILKCNPDFIFNKTNIKKKLNLENKDNLVPLFKNKKYYICGLLKILKYGDKMLNINPNILLITNNLFNTEYRLFNKEYMTTKKKIMDYIGEINDNVNDNVNTKITYKLNILDCILKNFAYLPKINIIKLPKPDHKYPTKKIRIH